MAIFRVFKMADDRHLGFLNSGNFNGRLDAEAQDASSCQILLKSVKWLRRYGKFSIVFSDGGRPPSWICGAHFGPSTKSTYRSLSSDKICRLESIE